MNSRDLFNFSIYEELNFNKKKNETSEKIVGKDDLKELPLSTNSETFTLKQSKD